MNEQNEIKELLVKIQDRLMAIEVRLNHYQEEIRTVDSYMFKTILERLNKLELK